MNRSIDILQHNITYWYSEDQEMPEHEQEHVEKMIADGYYGGELVDSDPESDATNTGWWEIA